MRKRNREINVFSMSALDLFASAMGAFILIAVVTLPFYLKTSKTVMEDNRKLTRENKALTAELQQCESENNALKQRVQSLEVENRNLRGQLQSTKEKLQRCEQEREALGQQVESLQNEKNILEDQAQKLQEKNNRLEQGTEGIRKENERLKRQNGNLQDELKKSFIAVTMHWGEQYVDIDLFVTTPEGRVFSFERGQQRYSDLPGEFVRDTKVGPGVELWQSPELREGRYKIEYWYFRQNGDGDKNHMGPEKAIVKGNIYTGRKSFTLPEITLTNKNIKVKKLIGIVNVDADMNVTLDLTQ